MGEDGGRYHDGQDECSHRPEISDGGSARLRGRERTAGAAQNVTRAPSWIQTRVLNRFSLYHRWLECRTHSDFTPKANPRGMLSNAPTERRSLALLRGLRIVLADPDARCSGRVATLFRSGS